MLSLLRGIMFLLLVLEKPDISDSLKCEDSGLKMFKDIPNMIIPLLESRNGFMDVFVPADCLKDNTALFKAFLDSREKPVTFWTDGKLHSRHCEDKICNTFRRSFFQIVYFICGKYDINNLWHSFQTNYFMSAIIVAEHRKRSSEGDLNFFRLPFHPSYLRASGRYVLSFDNGSLILTSEFESKVIEYQTLTRGLLGRQRALNGSLMRIACAGTYACQHPSINVTLQLLAHRNASVRFGRKFHVYEGAYLSTFINSLNNRADRDSGGLFDPLHHFASAGFSFYVRKRKPVPKETIFILPFCWEVWVGLLASCLLLVLTYGLISKFTLKGDVNIAVFVFPMVAAFFQQSTQLHTSLLNTYQFRLLYGTMALMFVVMSTAFKGRLTSLLNDLPLDGEATEFVSIEHLVGTGHRLCFLESPGILGALGPQLLFGKKKKKESRALVDATKPRTRLKVLLARLKLTLTEGTPSSPTTREQVLARL